MFASVRCVCRHNINASVMENKIPINMIFLIHESRGMFDVRYFCCLSPVDNLHTIVMDGMNGGGSAVVAGAGAGAGAGVGVGVGSAAGAGTGVSAAGGVSIGAFPSHPSRSPIAGVRDRTGFRAGGGGGGATLESSRSAAVTGRVLPSLGFGATGMSRTRSHAGGRTMRKKGAKQMIELFLAEVRTE